ADALIRSSTELARIAFKTFQDGQIIHNVNVNRDFTKGRVSPMHPTCTHRAHKYMGAA
ncbi:hypothetical protein BaRGS_00010795, partial [Batillaria attramentaria]